MKSTKFEKAIVDVLGITESKDKPIKPEIEGEKRTSAAGAHRFDSGVKFIEMKYDDQFKTKANYNKISP